MLNEIKELHTQIFKIFEKQEISNLFIIYFAYKSMSVIAS